MKKLYILILAFCMMNIANAQTTPYLFRGALLEYFSGHLSVNSPAADILASSLKSQFGDSIAIINIHSGFFANPNSSFPDDLRSSTGTAIDNFFGASNHGIPTGMISRNDYSNDHLQSTSAWKSKIQLLIHQTTSLLVDQTNIYNSSTRSLNSTIVIKSLSNLNGNYYLSAFLTEDSIISPMNTPTGVDTYHVNNNLLRTAINGDWGTLICSNTFHEDSIIIRNFNYQLNSTWNENHCKLVCFVYNDATKEVLQISQKAVLNNTPSTLAINELNSEKINVYPNPATNNLTINLSQLKNLQNTSVSIYDIQGKLLLYQNIQQPQTEINISQFAKGIYIVKVNSENENMQSKFVKE